MQAIFSWDPKDEAEVRLQFFKRVRNRLRNLITDATKMNEPPPWIPDSVSVKLKAHRNSPAFKAKSEIAKSNKRKAMEDGKIRPTHHTGSISLFEYTDRLVSFVYC